MYLSNPRVTKNSLRPPTIWSSVLRSRSEKQFYPQCMNHTAEIHSPLITAPPGRGLIPQNQIRWAPYRPQVIVKLSPLSLLADLHPFSRESCIVRAGWCPITFRKHFHPPEHELKITFNEWMNASICKWVNQLTGSTSGQTRDRNEDFT